MDKNDENVNRGRKGKKNKNKKNKKDKNDIDDTNDNNKNSNNDESELKSAKDNNRGKGKLQRRNKKEEILGVNVSLLHSWNFKIVKKKNSREIERDRQRERKGIFHES